MSTFPTKEKALGMYKKMYTIRKYEESIYYLFLEGIMPGSIHQSTGEEASAVGMLYDLGKDDWMATTHRPAGHDIAKGVSVKSMMCEMFGKAEGCCKGKGGAMHTGDISVGAMTANAIVGGDLPIAAGILCASGQLDPRAVRGQLFVGELSLEGAVRPVAGLLAYALCAQRLGVDLVCAPVDQGFVALDGLVRRAAKSLAGFRTGLNTE